MKTSRQGSLGGHQRLAPTRGRLDGPLRVARPEDSPAGGSHRRTFGIFERLGQGRGQGIKDPQHLPPLKERGRAGTGEGRQFVFVPPLFKGRIQGGLTSPDQIQPRYASVRDAAGAASVAAPISDGLTFDAPTGHLFITNFNGGTPGGIIEINPTTLGVVATHNGPSGGDGIASDGPGNMLIASRGDSRIYKLTLATNTLSQRTFVQGLDDLALMTGLGAPAPEPSTLVMAAAAVTFGLAAVRRKKMTTRA